VATLVMQIRKRHFTVTCECSNRVTSEIGLRMWPHWKWSSAHQSSIESRLWPNGSSDTLQAKDIVRIYWLELRGA